MTNTLTRWNPLRELEDFQNRILSAFNPAAARRSNGQDSLALPEWMPVVDIAEDDKEYLITAELPEVKKEDVKVMVENGVLTITGERKFEKEETNKKWHRGEGECGVQGWDAQSPHRQERSGAAQANRSEGQLTGSCRGCRENGTCCESITTNQTNNKTNL